MSRPLPIRTCEIHSLAIPMRRKVGHAAAQRVCSEPIVFSVELADGTVGYGETHPREYVSGESPADVMRSIREIFLPLLINTHPANFGEAIEAAAALPTIDDNGQPITAARAAVEIALLDAYSTAFQRTLESIAGYFEQRGFEPPGSRDTCRYTIVLPSGAPRKSAKLARIARLARITNYKVKVGDDDDDARLRAVCKVLRNPLASRTATLTIDANMAWDVDAAKKKLYAWRDLPIQAVEQPLPKIAAEHWGRLADESPFPLMPDESLITMIDAEALLDAGGAGWFNIRLSKNGGLIPAIKLAVVASRHEIPVQLGCMVGETSILSAAARWFLQMTPGVRRAEGSFGRLLLSDDVVARPVRFGLGGRWRPMTGFGLGIRVDPARLRRLGVVEPEITRF
ncbi:MAG: hypothetical protein H6819_06425 [Phycisphaerales bacterium]|nr:hypothetical protein [Phycisphaerales bacterium]MCB9858543.1 hypothetical protein [Phycisphaerales bacterium]